MKQRNAVTFLIRDKYDGNKDDPTYKEDAQRIKNGEPLDYVIGWKPFLGVVIDLSEHPLIPRAETEYWVGQVIRTDDRLKNKKKNLKVLDIFCGSGCIGVAIAKSCPNTKVMCCDKDVRMKAQVLRNIHINNLSTAKISFQYSDIWSTVKGRFDIICANPPYIPTTRKDTLPHSVIQYEPRHALFGGVNGLLFIKKFLKEVADHLYSTGACYLEFDHTQAHKIEKLSTLYGLKARLQKDQYGRYRYAVITKTKGKQS
jgi:release factor glutamine methyltransferase